MNTNILGLFFYSYRYFDPSSKGEDAGMKELIGTLRKKTTFKVTSWEVNLIYSRLWCFQLSHMEVKFG